MMEEGEEALGMEVVVVVTVVGEQVEEQKMVYTAVREQGCDGSSSSVIYS